jgi:hypothetical protein
MKTNSFLNIIINTQKNHHSIKHDINTHTRCKIGLIKDKAVRTTTSNKRLKKHVNRKQQNIIVCSRSVIAHQVPRLSCVTTSHTQQKYFWNIHIISLYIGETINCESYIHNFISLYIGETINYMQYDYLFLNVT